MMPKRWLSRDLCMSVLGDEVCKRPQKTYCLYRLTALSLFCTKNIYLCTAIQISRSYGSSTLLRVNPGNFDKFLLCSAGHSYKSFYDWLRQRQKKVVPVCVEGFPVEEASTVCL